MPGMVPPHVPPQMLNIPQTSLQAKPVAPQVPSPGGAPGQGPYPYSLSEPAPLTLDTSGKHLTEQNSYSNIPHEGKHTPLYERSSPINPAQSGSPNHVDSAYFPGSSTSSSSDNDEGSGGATKYTISWGFRATDHHVQGRDSQARGTAAHWHRGHVCSPNIFWRISHGPAQQLTFPTEQAAPPVCPAPASRRLSAPG
ncbi:C9orf129 isoform 1 [Pan troglodytes]|uniref:Family with sequence similarity 120A2, pseudo n=2 Tax=Pan troglodytes TaxID=9598 RepID=H2R6L1_PANTR|nr:putative uncharacterized protein FAM120A2P isoform X2 [Pan troglodytes]PNI17264.1 C9orf129 isoform 1 [Pan troglodytes]